MEFIAICYLVGMNLAAFVLYGLDKHRSKHDRRHRIPERDLFGVALLGGSVGALLGMQMFRHKTKHMSFAFGIPCILLAQLAVGWILLKRPFF